MRRRDFIRLVGGAAVFPFAASAQQPQAIDATLLGAVERKEIPGVVAMAADRKPRHLSRGVRGGRHRRGPPMQLGRAVPDCLDDQADHRGRRHAARRAGPPRPRRSSGEVFSGVCQAEVLESFDAATGAYKVRPATKTVTVRHLFTHTSGLGYRFTSPIVRDFKPRAGEIRRDPLLFEPGEQWMYGTSTDWLGRLVEKISGLSLDDYFRRRIFAPLKMSDTFYDVPQAKQARLVAAHRRQADGSLVKQPVQPRPTGSGPSAAAACRRPPATTSASCACCSTVASSTAPAFCRPAPSTRWRKIRSATSAVPALRSASPDRQRRLLVHRRRPRQMGTGVPDHERRRARQAVRRQPELGRGQQHLFLGRPGRGIAGVILMQFLPFADRKALALYDAFERGVYRLADAAR